MRKGNDYMIGRREFLWVLISQGRNSYRYRQAKIMMLILRNVFIFLFGSHNKQSFGIRHCSRSSLKVTLSSSNTAKVCRVRPAGQFWWEGSSDYSGSSLLFFHREKLHGVGSRGNQQQASESPLPGESPRLRFISPARDRDHPCQTLPTRGDH